MVQNKNSLSKNKVQTASRYLIVVEESNIKRHLLQTTFIYPNVVKKRRTGFSQEVLNVNKSVIKNCNCRNFD
jgi:hypothetical protein